MALGTLERFLENVNIAKSADSSRAAGASGLNPTGLTFREPQLIAAATIVNRRAREAAAEPLRRMSRDRQSPRPN